MRRHNKAGLTLVSTSAIASKSKYLCNDGIYLTIQIWFPEQHLLIDILSSTIQVFIGSGMVSVSTPKYPYDFQMACLMNVRVMSAYTLVGGPLY